MENLLKLIEKNLRDVNTTVICPVCKKKQMFKISELSKIRLGDEGNYTGTGGVPMIQCENCNEFNKVTLIKMDTEFYNELSNVVFNAINQQPAKYIDADYRYTTIGISNGISNN